MNFTIVDAEQRSEAWFAARAGRLTGSKADVILAKGRGGAESTVRRDYRIQLACERHAGKPQEGGYVNVEMQRGIDLEPTARLAYEALTGEMVRQTGFLLCTGLMVGCSLDGDIGNFTGIQEIKCPKTATHLSYWRNRDLFVADYAAQVTHNLWISGAQWCDLVSFDDRVDEVIQTLCVRVPRSEAAVAAYAKEAERFLAEVTVEYNDIQALIDQQKLKVAA